MTLHVMLVDDHAVVRAGYRRLLELEPDCVVSAECGDGDAAYALLQQRQPPPVDVIVLDLSMPGRSGFDLLRRIALRWPAVHTLVFSMHEGPALVAQARQTGRYQIPHIFSDQKSDFAHDSWALDALLFSDFLTQNGLTDPDLRWYLDYCCRDEYGAGVDQVSAWAGVHYFAARHGFQPDHAQAARDHAASSFSRRAID